MIDTAPYENEVESKWFSKIKVKDLDTGRWPLSPMEGEEFEDEESALVAMNEFKPTDDCFFIDDMRSWKTQKLVYEIGVYDGDNFIPQYFRMFNCGMKFDWLELK